MEIYVLGCTYRVIDCKCICSCQRETKLVVAFAPTLSDIDTYLNQLNIHNEKVNCIIFTQSEKAQKKVIGTNQCYHTDNISYISAAVQINLHPTGNVPQ